MRQAQFYNPVKEQPRIQTLADLYRVGAKSDGGLTYPVTHFGSELADGAAAASGLGARR
jgi:hypothetical protein